MASLSGQTRLVVPWGERHHRQGGDQLSRIRWPGVSGCTDPGQDARGQPRLQRMHATERLSDLRALRRRQ